MDGGSLTFTADTVAFSSDPTSGRPVSPSSVDTPSLTAGAASISSGAIDNTTVGLTIPAEGSFTSVSVGDYTLPTTDGAAGQVLSTDGVGHVVWADESSSPSFSVLSSLSAPPGSGMSVSADTTVSVSATDTIALEADTVLIDTDTSLTLSSGSGSISLSPSGVEVTGSLSISGGYSLPTSDGTTGQVLLTDGVGQVAWGDLGQSDLSPDPNPEIEGYLHVLGEIQADTYTGMGNTTHLDTTGADLHLGSTASYVHIGNPLLSAVADTVQLHGRGLLMGEDDMEYTMHRGASTVAGYATTIKGQQGAPEFAGGHIYLHGGDAGTVSGSSTRKGGNAYVDGGVGRVSDLSSNGEVYIGTSHAKTVVIGNSNAELYVNSWMHVSDHIDAESELYLDAGTDYSAPYQGTVYLGTNTTTAEVSIANYDCPTNIHGQTTIDREL
ncbi:hypothetical protein KIPB_010107, partial [Kipferlia bialata]|eukprot:g10107.t1